MKKYIGVTLLILSLIVMSGCLGGLLEEESSDGEINYGEIAGVITNVSYDDDADNTDLPIHIYVITEEPGDPSGSGAIDPEEDFNIAAQKVIEDGGSNSYKIGGLVEGQYYVVAHKDLNEDGLIQFDPEGAPEQSEIIGFYPLTEDNFSTQMDDGPEKVVVKSGETITNIDFIVFHLSYFLK